MGEVDAIRRQAIVDFIGRQSVVYKRHSALAVLEDIELACTEFGCTVADFYDAEDL